MVGLPSRSTYWVATCPFSNSSLATSSLTTNLPSPCDMAMLWQSFGVKLDNQGDLLLVTFVVAICETWRLMLLRNKVGEASFSSSILPYGNKPLLINAWNPLQIPRIRPSLSNNVWTASFTNGLLKTFAINLPLPSGSSPLEKPPTSIKIWAWAIFSLNSFKLRSMLVTFRLLKT